MKGGGNEQGVGSNQCDVSQRLINKVITTDCRSDGANRQADAKKHHSKMALLATSDSYTGRVDSDQMINQMNRHFRTMSNRPLRPIYQTKVRFYWLLVAC